ncbi:endonuclease domain-containing protein [Evansella clarkii]|uniref:endonuclease domain-containing protein n=1 Tax=Evansella clarkii TaxID=79879 RepID=UPI000B44EF71|nr:DUF559 domain-containing protein [Evansella clarkii]
MLTYLVYGLLFAGLIVLPGYCAIKSWNQPKEVLDWERNKTESPIERRLLDALRAQGYSPRTQIPAGPYRIDIAFPAYKLAIECDGKQYHSGAANKARDRRKDTYLRRNGWQVLRFSGRKINGDTKRVVSRIESELIKRQSK